MKNNIIEVIIPDDPDFRFQLDGICRAANCFVPTAEMVAKALEDFKFRNKNKKQTGN